jgi:TonB family protein
MLRSLALTLLAAMSVLTAPVVARAADKLYYAEGGMLVLLAPAFPKEALARGESATVTVAGNVQTDGRLEDVLIETVPPNAAFESAVRQVVPLWRLQPRIVPPGCGAAETSGRVTIWFEIEEGKPKVRYATAHREGPKPEIRNDRAPVRAFAPRYPAKFAVDPKTPKAVLQVAYVGVAEDGSVINVTLAPMLYYRDFEQDIFEAVRQWKYEPQGLPWCGEAVFNLALEPKS